jgi:hypothetical protein
MGTVAIDAQGQSDGSANYLRKDDTAGPEHTPAATRGISKEQFDARMSHPAARAAIARVKAKHAALDRGRRRGAISEDVARRASSKLAQSLNEGHAMQFKRQTGDKRSVFDILDDMRRFADHLDAAGLMHPGQDPEDTAGERAAMQGTTITSAGYDRQHAQDERQARRGAAAGNASRSGDTWSGASGI